MKVDFKVKKKFAKFECHPSVCPTTILPFASCVFCIPSGRIIWYSTFGTVPVVHPVLMLTVLANIKFLLC